jgi:hypothetical protein
MTAAPRYEYDCELPKDHDWPLIAAFAGATAALLGYYVGRNGCVTVANERIGLANQINDAMARELAARELRNAALVYRPIGASWEPYPDWVRALDGKSGVYVIRETQRDGSEVTVYVGESHTDRLYQTLTRHFQTWRRSKKFWTGQYGGQGHDPGLTYPRDQVTVAVRVLAPARAIEEETRLIQRLRPRDNLIGQPADDEDDTVPF